VEVDEVAKVLSQCGFPDTTSEVLADVARVIDVFIEK
jgi:hypothetical protein